MPGFTENVAAPARAPHAGAENSDEAIAIDAARDVPGAFDRLARRYQVPLYRFLLRCTSSAEDAEDVLQETFVKLYAARARFRLGAAYRPWAFAIARRAAVDLARRKRSAVVLPLGDSDPPERQTAAFPATLDGDSLWLFAKRTLTSEQVQALWLYHVEDMKAADIAVVLNRSWVSVKAMLVRARQRLRRELASNANNAREVM